MTDVILTDEAPDGPEPAGRLRSLTARVLRGLGATVLVASLSVFLFQGWSETGDLGRYGLLLAQTALLMAAGLASGRWLREPKGARVFVAIALVAVVANCAVLGGLLWSQYGGAAIGRAPPNVLVWEAVSGAWALAATVGALVLLAPLCRLGFTVLARPAAGRLTLLLLASAAILLVPVRDALAVAVLAGLALVAVIATARRLVPGEPALRTPEGAFALGVALIPVGVILGRGMLFYPDAAIPAAVAAAGVQAVLREAGAQAKTAPMQRSLEAISAVAAIPTALLAATAAVGTGPLPDAAWLPLSGLVSAGLFVDLSRRTTTDAAGYRLAGALLAALATAANVALFDGLLVAVVALAVGIAVTACAFAERQAWLLLPAAVAAFTGLGDLVGYAVGHIEIGAWGWLALIGTATVIAGSLTERSVPARWVARWRG